MTDDDWLAAGYLPCDRCGKVTKQDDIHTCTPRHLTDEVIADLWYQNGTHHHHFARAIERWLKQQ
jgi:hypothetical protein